MAHIFYQPTSRRRFLQSSLAAVGALSILGIDNVTAKESSKEAHLAFLSDTHISEDVANNYRGFFMTKNLQKIVPQVTHNSPEGVIISGDLARLEGKSGDYANLKKILTPLAKKMPVYMGLGNHDNRKNFLAAFSPFAGEEQPVKDKHVIVVRQGPIRLIILDSLLYINRVAGLLGKAQRLWLQDYLQKSDDTPTLLVVHHTLDDGDGDLLDVDKLYSMIKPQRKVKGIVYGHSHHYHYDVIDGLHLINVPAVGYNFGDEEPVGWVEAHLHKSGGDFILHAIGGSKEKDGKMTSLDWRG
ncbi:MAG: hypothetical protein GWP06_06705 [Actinobacteria bacterium]|nr:hypothetical protein [Actinomycetota bacterium]